MPDRSRALLVAVVFLGALLRCLWPGTPLTFSDAPHHAWATTTFVYSLGPSFLYQRYWKATLDDSCDTPCSAASDPQLRERFIAESRSRGRTIGLGERLLGLDHGFTIHALSFPFYLGANWIGLRLTETVLNFPLALVGSLAILLVYGLARELGRDPVPSGVAALVIALAPMHVGYSRSTAGTFVVATFFSALTVFCYARYFGTRRLRWHVAAITSLVLWTGGDNLFLLAPIVLVGTALAVPGPVSRRRALVSLLPGLIAVSVVVALFYLRDLEAIRREGPRATGFLIRLWTKGTVEGWQFEWLWRGAIKLFGGSACLLVILLASVGIALGRRAFLPTWWLLVYVLPFTLYLAYTDAMLHILVPVAILAGDGVAALSEFVRRRRPRLDAAVVVALVILALTGALMAETAALFDRSRPFPDAHWKWYYGRRVPDAGSKAVGFLLRTRYLGRPTCAFAEGVEFYWGRDLHGIRGAPDYLALPSCEVLVAWARKARPYMGPGPESIQDVVLRRALAHGFRVGEIVQGLAGEPLVYVLTREASAPVEHDVDGLNRRFDLRFGWLPALAVPDRGRCSERSCNPGPALALARGRGPNRRSSTTHAHGARLTVCSMN